MKIIQIEDFIEKLKEECKTITIIDCGILGEVKREELDKDKYISLLETNIRKLLLNCD